MWQPADPKQLVVRIQRSWLFESLWALIYPRARIYILSLAVVDGVAK